VPEARRRSSGLISTISNSTSSKWPTRRRLFVEARTGKDDHGPAKEWRKQDGSGSGYEGFLVDNYHTLLAVLDRDAAIKRNARTGSKP